MGKDRVDNKNIKYKKNKALVICCMVILLIVVLISSIIKIIDWNKTNKENEEMQKNLLSYVEEITSEDTGEKEYKVDFKALKEINPDTVAYIKVNNTNINYVVVKGNDNSYYLNHNFENNYNSLGWIFADYKNKFNLTDYNIVIYGKNPKNDSMFGTLKNFLKKEWLNNDENKYITLVTDEAEKKYEVFSVYQEKTNKEPIQVDFNKDDEYLGFLNIIKSKSIKDFNIELNATHGIITLVAYDSNNSNRIIVHAINVL